MPDALYKDFEDLMVEVFNKAITIADKHACDRNEALQQFAHLFVLMVSLGNYTYYKPDEK